VLTQLRQFLANQAPDSSAVIGLGVRRIAQRECRCCSPKLATEKIITVSLRTIERAVLPRISGNWRHKREGQFGLRPRPVMSFSPTLASNPWSGSD
jgi:hypothetical protein